MGSMSCGLKMILLFSSFSIMGLQHCIKALNVLYRLQSTHNTGRWTHINFETKGRKKEIRMCYANRFL